MITLLVFIFTLLILVVVHELGHFFAAKAFGVHVEEFGVGYPPRASKLFRWKGTLFTLNWLPFGGFVKIVGEQGDAHQDPHSFAAQALWKRAVILLGGIVANFLFAFFLYSLSFGTGFLASPDAVPVGAHVGASKIMITGVRPSSPAALSGIKADDTITQLTVGTTSITPTTVNDVITFVHAHGTDAIRVGIIDKGVARTVSVTPEIKNTTPAIGIELTDAVEVKLSFWQAIAKGFSYTCEQSVLIFVTLGQLIRGGSINGQSVASQLSGPVGIAQVAGQAFSLGFGALLSIMALISVNLAALNILPFPALDGGRLVLEFFTKNGKSRIPTSVINGVNQAGFGLLILLMLYVTYHDIGRLLGH